MTVVPPEAAQPGDHESSTFVYKTLAGTVVTLPRFKSIMTFGRARKMRKLDEGEQMFALMEQVCDEAALGALDEMDLTETETFFSAWQKDSGVDVGGSSA